jgi:peptidoglycan/xylan/chitin deacetylase (PgdA/CDA1 family)
MPFERPTWPNGARCAVTLTFDNFGESLDLIRYGHAGGASSDGVYAPRRGVERILDVLDRHQIPATFFVEGWNARKYASLAREIVARGHELGSHGWMHEPWEKLDRDTEADLIQRTTETLADIIGRPPRGWRSPGGVTTTSTLGLIHDAGYAYDSSFGDDDIPYMIQVSAARSDELVEIPWSWPLDDAPFYSQSGAIRRPSELMAFWREEFDAAMALTGCFSVICHPRFSGRPARILALETLIEYIQQQPGVWFARCEDIAAHVRGDAKTPHYRAPEIMPR